MVLFLLAVIYLEFSTSFQFHMCIFSLQAQNICLFTRNLHLWGFTYGVAALQRQFCITPESPLKESVLSPVTNDGFHQAELGSYCWDENIFVAFSLCSCRILSYRRFFTFCGNCGLLLDQSANLCNSVWGGRLAFFLKWPCGFEGFPLFTLQLF